MSKRAAGKFERRERDFYPTPRAAVPPLIPHLVSARVHRFAEPCCGDGDLVRHLESFGLRCVYQGDLADGQDALAHESYGAPVITNPPWSRPIMHALILHFLRAAPFSWLLFDAAWSHTLQSRDLIRHCSHILPIGRLKWIPDSPFNGKDDIAWHRFTQDHEAGPILLPFRSDVGTRESHTCAQCGLPYRSFRSDGRFCSDTCRKRAQRARLVVT